VTAEQLSLAQVDQLKRLASYLGVPLPRARNNERDYHHALSHAILRYLKRGGRRRLARFD
jgi:hypothetical protein